MDIIDFQGKKIIITGAGSGIGRETARVLNEHGAFVVMMDINEEGLKETASLCGNHCHTMVIDLTDPKAVA